MSSDFWIKLEEFLDEVWGIARAIWDTSLRRNRGNRILRLALLFVLAWPFLMVGLATLTPAPPADLKPGEVSTNDADRFLISAATFIPFLLLVVLLLLRPLLVAVIGAFPTGRRMIRLLFTIVGLECFFGLFLWLVPVWRDRGLILPFLAGGVILFCLGLGLKDRGRLVGWAIRGVTLFMLALTAIFLLGGRTGAQKKWEGLKPIPKVVTPIEQRDFVEDGERIKLVFPPGRDFAEVAVPLSTTNWSRWIDASDGASWWIESVEKAGFTVLFKDNHRHEVGPNDKPNFGEHIPIMRAMGTVPGQWLKVTAFQR